EKLENFPDKEGLNNAITSVLDKVSADYPDNNELQTALNNQLTTIRDNYPDNQEMQQAIAAATAGIANIESVEQLQKQLATLSAPKSWAMLSEDFLNQARYDSTTPSQALPMATQNRWIARKLNNLTQSDPTIIEKSGDRHFIEPGKYLVMGYSSIIGATAAQTRFRTLEDNFVMPSATDLGIIATTGTSTIPMAKHSSVMNFFGIVEIAAKTEFWLETIVTNPIDPGSAGGVDLVEVNVLGKREDFDTKAEYSKLVLLKVD
ncbi:MAG: hypothetical protein AAFR37_08625, partial [Cyanobacteria bacterium J06628_3]